MSNEADKMDTLHQQLSTLEELFQEVALQYESAATSLRDGHLPDRTPGFQLDAARKVFNDTLTVLSEAGEAYGLAPVSENASLPSAIDYLKVVGETKKEIERQQKLIADARMVVAEALLLNHQTESDTLESVSSAADQLAKELDENNHEEAERVVQGVHPLSRLLAYANHRESLNDEEYDSFRLNIEENFGRAVLRDIDRGRITVSSSLPFNNEVIVDEAQEDTQNEIIDIIDEIEVDYVEEESTENGTADEPEVFEETMHDEHEPFWPPSFDDNNEEESTDDALNGEFEIDEDFDPEEDTMTGRLSSNEEAAH